MPGLDSEVIDFRAASESFAAVRRLGKKDMDTLRLVTEHEGHQVNQQTQYDLWHAEQDRKKLRVRRLAA